DHQRAMVAARDAEALRCDFVFRQLAVAKFRDPGRTADCYFVDSVAAMHDPRTPRSERVERVCHWPDQIFLGDAQQMEVRTRGAADRAHQVEDGANSQLASER